MIFKLVQTNDWLKPIEKLQRGLFTGKTYLLIFTLLISSGQTECNRCIWFSGDYRAGVTPLPIPNREVKLRLADGTTTAGLWESRSSPDFILKPVNRNVDRFFLFIYPYFARRRRALLPLSGGDLEGVTTCRQTLIVLLPSRVLGMGESSQPVPIEQSACLPKRQCRQEAAW